MTEIEIRNKIDEIKEQQRELLDNAESEKRSLTDEEKHTFEHRQNQIADLNRQLSENTGNKAETAEKRENKSIKSNIRKMDFKKKIAVALRAIANNDSVEGLDYVKGNVIELRDDEPTPETPTAETTLETNIQDIQSEYPTELIEPLQDALLVNKVGVKVINTGKAVVMPSVNNVEATIEGETTELVGKKLDFGKTKVNPVRGGLSLPFSNTAIAEADINLVNYAIKVQSQAKAQLINKVMFSKTTISGVKGCFVDAYADATPKALANVVYDDIIGLQATVAGNNVEFDNTIAYVMAPDALAHLLTTPKMQGKQAGAAGFIAEGDIHNATINGVPVLVSQAAAGYIGFGKFSDYLIQTVGADRLIVDMISRSKEDITEINDNYNFALQTVRTESFACIALS